MGVYDTYARVSANGQLETPWRILEALPRQTDVRLIMLVPEPEGDSRGCDWKDAATKEFFSGYAEADAVYDTF